MCVCAVFADTNYINQYRVDVYLHVLLTHFNQIHHQEKQVAFKYHI